ncbi:MAG: hypothetical protein AAB553_07850 [Patescibacteria group bacterium]
MMKKQSTLYCFSPLVMITTFLIELGAAFFVLFRYRMTRTAQLIVAMLGFLAFFQLAEFMVCESAVFLSSLDWARLGYVAITFLPPLGIHLGLTIVQKKNPLLLLASYGSAMLFSAFFLFVGHGMQGEQCLGNYIIFAIAPYAVIPYGLYYYGWLLTGVGLFLRLRKSIKESKKRQALLWLIVGYLSFMLPTIGAHLINPETVAGAPSIMCGFAILMALSLLFKVTPLVLKESQNEEVIQKAY